MSRCLKEALTRTDTNWAKAKANLASKREKREREAEAAKAREELAKTKKRAKEKAMEKCKASTDFMAEKAQKKPRQWWSCIHRKSFTSIAVYSAKKPSKRATN